MIARGGVIVVPAFAVGRTQLLLYLLARLKARGAIPDIPVFLNSPMATDATRIYHEHRREHRLTDGQCKAMCTAAVFVNSVEESKSLNERHGPAVIVAASGMATGGRVVHHLKGFAMDKRNMILFTGFQAPGTRGAALIAGTDAIKIHGEWIPVRAAIAQLQSTSAHADREQLVAWLKRMEQPPERVFVTHGEPEAADTLRQHIRRHIATDATVPEHGESIEYEARGNAKR